MVEELWQHAMLLLDKIRTGEGGRMEDLYKFDDHTGLLGIHEQMLSQPYQHNEVNMKIMYYELIKMILDYERESSKDEDLYDSTKAILKIEGYQELTNKLQRFLNKKFILNFEQLNNKHVIDANARSEPSDVKLCEKISELEKNLETLSIDHKLLKESCRSLECQNAQLLDDVADLKQKLTERDIDKDTNSISNTESESEHPVAHFEEQLSAQTDAVAKLDDKMEKVISQANILLINDATHLERISNLERQATDIEGKLSNLESADLYLQESCRMATERTSLVEKYSKYIEEKVKYLTTEKEKVALNEHHSDASSKIGDIDKRLLNLENLLSKVNEKSSKEVSSKSIIDSNTILRTIENTRIESNSHKEIVKSVQDQENSDATTELISKYTTILQKVEKMESQLEEQLKQIQQNSEKTKPSKIMKDKLEQSERIKIFKETLKELRSEKLESITQLELHTKEFGDVSLCLDVALLTTEVENIKNVMHFTKLLSLPEHNIKIFEFLEMLVEMNKSLNDMMENLLNTKTEVEKVVIKQEEQAKAIDHHNFNFEQVFKNLEEADIQKICDQEVISQKIENIENILEVLREKLGEVEDMSIVNKSASTAKADDFSIDGSLPDLKNKGVPNSRSGNSRWLGSLFNKQPGTICC